MKTSALLFTLLLCLTATLEGRCQETVFTLLKSERKLADQYFHRKNYQGALNLYQHLARKNSAGRDIIVMTARCHYFLKQFDLCLAVYEKYLNAGNTFAPEDLYYYAEAHAGVGNYKKAMEYYRKYLATSQEDMVMKKIWRLSNIKFLYEDSLHYAVNSVPLNTGYGELCPAAFRDGLVFMSNRKEVQIIDKMDGALNAPFYRIYYSQMVADTTDSGDTLLYAPPVHFSKELNAKFHAGPVVFYNRFQKMVFSSTGNAAGTGVRTLQLFFAEAHERDWNITQPFPYNSAEYSVTDPAISEDGTTLYFSSDMKGGLGGKDLYRSDYKNGQWTKPKNLGEPVNTPGDEAFPYLHQDKVLYFSSNGHAGLGGLDIFRVTVTSDKLDEPENVGYPLNTSFDEFGITIDSLHTHGYLSSNRKNGGYNDDLYEFSMDLQTYPLTISGLVRFKEHSWSDSSELKTMPNAKVYLIDNLRNITAYETVSDASGNFSITIPCFSQYKIRVIGEDNDENIVSLELRKQRKLHTIHEIVIIKDAFKTHKNQE